MAQTPFWLNKKVKNVIVTGGLKLSEFNVTDWPYEKGYCSINRYPRDKHVEVTVIQDGEYPDWVLVLSPLQTYPQTFVDDKGWKWHIDSPYSEPHINLHQYNQWRSTWKRRMEVVSKAMIMEKRSFTYFSKLSAKMIELIERQNPMDDFPFESIQDDRSLSERRNDVASDFDAKLREDRHLLDGESIRYIQNL